MVLERDRREENREAVGGRDRASDREGAQIGTDQVELVLNERKHRAKIHIRGIDRDQRTAELDQIGIGRAMEHEVVIDLLHLVVRPIEGVEPPLPVPRQQIHAVDAALEIDVQEILLEIGEDPVAIEAVIGGRKAAARDRRH
jgi:hypothetical protein